MSKITVTAKYLKELAVVAIKHGTERHWMDIAIEWMEHADKEIQRLQDLLKEKE